MKAFIFGIFFLLAAPPIQAATIETFPTVPYDRFIIYQSLILFWLFILGLMVILRLKLKEIERVQKLKLDTPDDQIPYLS